MAGDGMWIWYLSRAQGGNVNRIAKQAHKRGIEYVLVKSGDAGHTWSQFSPSLVSALHARGLKVCGWQFVYGDNPKGEAKVGAAAMARGADCLVGDPGRAYLPREHLELVALYDVPVPQTLEDTPVKRTTVWRPVL